MLFTVLLAACGKEEPSGSKGNEAAPTQAVQQEEVKTGTAEANSQQEDAAAAANSGEAGNAEASGDASNIGETGNTAASGDTSNIGNDDTTADSDSANVIKKVQGASDDTGIYAFIVTLSDKAADKGTLEYVYYGPKGEAQENSIVCTFRAEYYKEESGTFDIMTYYDNEIYQHMSHKSEVKVDLTFGAMVRGGNVTVYYTPDGGERTQIYYAEAEEFRG